MSLNLDGDIYLKPSQIYEFVSHAYCLSALEMSVLPGGASWQQQTVWRRKLETGCSCDTERAWNYSQQTLGHERIFLALKAVSNSLSHSQIISHHTLHCWVPGQH